MATNRNYGKLTVDGAIEYAPSAMHTELGFSFNPSESDYLAAGWLRIARNAPETREGCTSRRTGYEARDGQIWAVYEYVAIEPEPRNFSKLKLLKALGSRSLAAPFLAWVAESGYEPLWIAAQDLSESYEGFSGIVEQVRNSLGIDGETVETILSEAVV